MSHLQPSLASGRRPASIATHAKLINVKNGLIMRRVAVVLVVAALLAFSIGVGIAVSYWRPAEINR